MWKALNEYEWRINEQMMWTALGLLSLEIHSQPSRQNRIVVDPWESIGCRSK
jgi:hypothetical protein